ncbi:MAG: flagellin [Thermaerobacter sp.]|nr:flagellin [Thermaerobacter sp.]
MFVNTNVAALNAWLNLDNTQNNMTSVMQQLSSGQRINSAANDPAGLAISQQMQSQISGMNQAYRNAQSGITLLQTADGAMGQVQNILQSMYSLASEAATGTNNSTDLQALQQEMNQYAQEITQIANTTQFNNLNLLGGVFQGQQIQIGANAGQSLGISIGAVDAHSLGVGGTTVSTINTTGQPLIDTTLGANATGITASASGTTYTVGANVTPFSLTSGSGTSNMLSDFSAVSGQYTGATTATVAFDVAATAVGATTTAVGYSVNGGATTTVNITLSGGAVTIDTGSGTLVFDTGTITAGTASTVTTGTVYVGAMQTQFSLYNGSSTVISSSTYSGGIGPDQAISMSNSANTEAFSFNALQNATTTTVTYNVASGTATISAVGTNFAYTSSNAFYTVSPNENVVLTDSGTSGSGTVSSFTAGTVSNGIDIQNQANANAALTVIQNAINQVSSTRATVGALQNRLQFASTDLQTSSQNLTTARSNIVNADVALQMVNLTKDQVLQQAGVAMLAQANAMPQALLKLFP